MSSTQFVHQTPSDSSHLKLTAVFPGIKKDELFAYFTQPDLLTQWWPQSAELKPHRGGLYKFTWPAMEWTLYGEVVAFEPGEKLAYTWNWEHEPDTPTRLVEIEFHDTAEGSEIVLRHGAYPDDSIEEEEHQSHLEGWDHFLGKLRDLIEGSRSG
jgi:uncharacterized protein YndB with AHSA1/START domain